MNREIKFRAWDGKDMVYCPFSPYNNDTVDINEQFRCLQVNGLKLMQFTGLHDRNGKEIYEGDILEFASFGGRYTVEYKVALMGFFPAEAARNQCEIIGNIYENPDLLK